VNIAKWSIQGPNAYEHKDASHGGCFVILVVYQNIGDYHEDATDVEDHTAVHSLDASTVAGEEKEVARHPVVADAQAVFNFLFDDVLLVELVGN